MKLSLIHRIWIYAVTFLLFATGALWAISRFGLSTPGKLDLVQAATQHWAMTIHGICSMVFLIVFGTLFPVHMKRAWAAKRNIVPGVGLVVLLFVLITTSCGLYYLGNETFRAVFSWIHLVGGACLPPAMLWHVILGRRSANRAKSA